LQETLTYESEKAAEHLQFVDGLAWCRGVAGDPRTGFLAVADVRQRKILRLDANPQLPVLLESDGGASGLAYDLQGRLFICESEARRITRLDQKGKLEVLAEGYQGKRFNAPNDIVVRRDGHAYFTDPAFGNANDNRELDFYGIWHLSPRGEPDVIAKWQTRPNGIALSADGKVLFVADSDRHAVVAIDLDKGNQRDVIKDIEGVPGGIRTDVDGRFYVAAKGVGVYSPQGRLQRTLLEGERATNCAFGDADTESLYISSRGTVFRVRLGVKGALQY